MNLFETEANTYLGLEWYKTTQQTDYWGIQGDYIFIFYRLKHLKKWISKNPNERKQTDISNVKVRRSIFLGDYIRPY